MSTNVPRLPAILAALALMIGSPARAQERPAATEPRPEAALHVFVDCQGVACDEAYLQTEIPFVTYVRERQDAQVDIFITMQRTDARGAVYAAQFIGRKAFAGDDDSLHYSAPATATSYEIRGALAQLLKRGLLRYVNHTPFGSRIQVTYTPPADTRTTTQALHDPWNHWVYSMTLSGSANGERSATLASVSGSFSADRTTEAWKISSSVQAGYSENRVDAGAGGTFRTYQRNYAFDALVVRSVGAHWAAGVRGTLTSSTFLNQSLTLRTGPAVEYNLFPYAESMHRQLTVQYSLGVTHLDYIERTIFGKLSQQVMDERLLASMQFKEPWGGINMSIEGSHVLDDVGKRRGIGVADADVRLFRGVSLVLIGGVELVQDQLFLPQRGASTEEVLLRQREQATSYRYFSSIGISYTFGSPFATVVNSRFAGSSTGTNIIQ